MNVMERMEAENTDQKIASFIVKQKQDYQFKTRYAEIRAREFYSECCKRGLECHVSVGGLDSITLLLFLRSIGIHVPAISVSHLEDKSIQAVHKQLGVRMVGRGRRPRSCRNLGSRFCQRKLRERLIRCSIRPTKTRPSAMPSSLAKPEPTAGIGKVRV